MADEKDPPEDPPETYQVGRGKPPLHSRFVKGKSGNPTGKRGRPESFLEVVLRILGERVELGEQGRRKRFTKLEVIGKQLVNHCAAGERAWLRELLTVLQSAKSKATSSRQDTREERSELADQEAREALARLTPKEQRQFFALLAKARGRNPPVEEDEPDENSESDKTEEPPKKN